MNTESHQHRHYGVADGGETPRRIGAAPAAATTAAMPPLSRMEEKIVLPPGSMLRSEASWPAPPSRQTSPFAAKEDKFDKKPPAAAAAANDATLTKGDEPAPRPSASARRVRPKPKRPLSAYNLFFKHERSKIVGESSDDDEDNDNDDCDDDGRVESASEGERGGDPSSRRRRPAAAPRDDQDAPLVDAAVAPPPALPAAAAAAARRRKRKRAPHGKIGFAELASVVSRKWRDLDEQSRAVFEALAGVERKRYERDLARWNEERAAEAERILAEQQTSRWAGTGRVGGAGRGGGGGGEEYDAKRGGGGGNGPGFDSEADPFSRLGSGFGRPGPPLSSRSRGLRRPRTALSIDANAPYRGIGARRSRSPMPTPDPVGSVVVRRGDAGAGTEDYAAAADDASFAGGRARAATATGWHSAPSGPLAIPPAVAARRSALDRSSHSDTAVAEGRCRGSGFWATPAAPPAPAPPGPGDVLWRQRREWERPVSDPDRFIFDDNNDGDDALDLDPDSVNFLLTVFRDDSDDRRGGRSGGRRAGGDTGGAGVGEQEEDDMDIEHIFDGI